MGGHSCERILKCVLKRKKKIEVLVLPNLTIGIIRAAYLCCSLMFTYNTGFPIFTLAPLVISLLQAIIVADSMYQSDVYMGDYKPGSYC